MGFLELIFGKRDGRKPIEKGCEGCRYNERKHICEKYPMGIPNDFRLGKVRCPKKGAIVVEAGKNQSW